MPTRVFPAAGYNALIDALLEGTEVRLDTDFLLHREALTAEAAHIVYTGPIDAYFNYCYGASNTVPFDSNMRHCRRVTIRDVPW